MSRNAHLTPADKVQERLSSFPKPQRTALQRTWEALCAALPGAHPAISYGLPTLQVDGTSVIAVDGFNRHNSLFPYSGKIIANMSTWLPAFETTKGSIHFPADQAFPVPLAKRIVRIRIQEINDSFPNRSGVAKAFFDNGFTKSTGKVKDGQMHGAWAWFRRDGTLMRTGNFHKGTRIGQWNTYDRAGNQVSSTQMS